MAVGQKRLPIGQSLAIIERFMAENFCVNNLYKIPPETRAGMRYLVAWIGLQWSEYAGRGRCISTELYANGTCVY